MTFSHAAMVEHHLTHNHYPPVSPVMVPFAVKAIAHARDGKLDKVIDDLGDSNGKHPTVHDLCEAWHLWDFLEGDDDDD